ncbi:thioredoxin domain-containing protein 16 [Megalops cyprinoides]|uniref:thioredoxin domain-containing protein 16 n=1 Tax=Megalops cyprinoides TaxID=118141 RepID=UPI0018642DEB|nr:thioredoxin domain-containing protein 16 [Megalops cyprinoides]
MNRIKVKTYRPKYVRFLYLKHLLPSMAWAFCFLVFFLCIKTTPCVTANTSKLIDHTKTSFLEALQSGKTSFVYFGNQVNPTIRLFLEHLEKSADALEDYGILVAKVNCTKERVPKYCTGEKLMKKVYLFRGSDVLKNFDADTVFDVDAIVAHVLFAVLFNEVRYVQTPAELLSIERIAKGLADVVLAYVQILGLPEHRAVMEATFVYGTKYQFVLTTGGSVLKHMGVEDPSSLQSGLWFLHCKEVMRRSDPCHHTALKRPLTTLNIYTFLQLMEAPLVTETRMDPTEVETVHNRLRTPLLFLFTQAETLAVDRNTAETLAWRLRGEVGLALVHRDSPDVKTPQEYNAAYRLPAEGSAVKYFTLKNIEEVFSLFREEPVQDEEEDKEDEEDWAVLDVLDDEVAESVYRDRDLGLDLELILELTADTFNKAVTEYDHVVVLFFVKWDAVSMAFMQSYQDVAETLEGVAGVQLACVDCGEWTDVCSSEGVSAFPTVRVYRPGEPPQPYRGMLGAESLSNFIMLCHVPTPVLLPSEEKAWSFLGGELHQGHAALSPVRVLGLFGSSPDSGRGMFEEAARLLRGETVLGLFSETQTQKWAEDYSVTLPAILLSRGPGTHIEPYSLHLSTVEEMAADIRKAVLDSFPELTVENLPSYLELGKPLLLLFVGDEGDEEEEEEEGARQYEAVRGELRSLQGTGRLDSYLPCWIHLGRTPSGRAVLESYLGSVPMLPALVLSQLSTGREVFQYPPEQPLLSEGILQWLQRVEKKEEQPAGVISDEKWGPPVPFYDFLSIMDQEAPGYAAQKSPKLKISGREVEEEGLDKEGISGDGRTLNHKLPKSQLGPRPPHQHNEL